MRVGLRKKSLLIVDDNAGVLEALAEIGAAVGFDVVTAISHRTAIRAIDRRRFDAALVDKRLVELDTENRDGLAVLGHLHERGEGTALILLTGKGRYRDGVEATEKYGARLLEKKTELSFAATVRQVLTETANIPPQHRRLTPLRAWCGDVDPMVWEMMASAVLRPRPDIGVMLGILEELAVTCEPILERPEDGGLQKADDKSLVGLFWSRGLGEAVMVTLQHEPIRTAPMLAHWPRALKIEEELHRIGRRTIVASISRCSGVEPTEFSVPRLFVD